MIETKPQVVYFSDEQEMINLVKLNLSHTFDVTGVTSVPHIDQALNTLRQIKPDYVLVDPRLSHLDHQQLYRQIKADQELAAIQILVIRDEGSEALT